MSISGDRADAQIHVSATGNTSKAVSALGQLEEAAGRSWWGIQNLGRAFLAFPAAVAAGIGAATHFASTWEDSMRNVQRTTGLAGEELADLEEVLVRISRTRPTGSNEIAAIAAEAGALGVEGAQNIGKFTEATADLAAVSDLAEEEAAEGLARIAAMTGIAGEGFDNLASTIVAAGVDTAATESQIVDLATQLAGLGRSVGLSADEIIGFATAMRSAGVRSQQGATAFQKTVIDIASAVSKGGDEIKIFAALAQQETQQFARTFREDAGEALTQFIVGLGNMQDAGRDVIGALREVGIVEQRQLRTLQLLAAAQAQNTNENFKLTKILGITNDALRAGTRLGEQTSTIYNTLSAEVQKFNNALFQTGRRVGNNFIGPLKSAFKFVRQFVMGLAEIPVPIQIAIGAITALIAVILGLAAGMLLLGSRFALAVGSLLGLKRQFFETGVAASGLTASVNTATGAVTRLGAATSRSQIQIVGLVNTTNSHILTTKALIATQGAATVSTRTLTGALVGLRSVLASLGIGLVFTGIAVAIQRLGAGTEKAEENIQNLIGPQEELKRRLIDTTKSIEDETRAWAQEQLRVEGVEGSFKRLGISHSEVVDIISGGAESLDQHDKLLADINKNIEAGVPGAREFGATVAKLALQAKSTKEEVSVFNDELFDGVEAQDELTDSTEDSAEALNKQRDRLQEVRDVLEQMARASTSLVEAQFSQREAQFALDDALEDYNQALEEHDSRAQLVLDAEADLESARLSHRESLHKLEEAELDLSRSRIVALENLADAEDDLLDARDDHADAIQDVADLEQELDDVRSGPTIEEITKAVNDLREAQLRLARAHQSVADSEFMLQFLRQEGAAERDIREAELNLEEARLDVAQSDETLIDAEKELADLRDDQARQEKIIDLERDLASARRDVASTARDVVRAEREVRDQRSRVQEDIAFREAQLDLARAQESVRRAAGDVQDAEQALRDARMGDQTAENLAQAQLDLEQAYYKAATAAVDVKRQQALLRGETFDVTDATNALRSELAKMAESIPVEAVKKNVDEFVKIIDRAPKSLPDIPDAVEEASEDTQAALDGLMEGLGEVPGQIDAMSELTSKEFEDMFRDNQEEIDKGGSGWVGAVKEGLKKVGLAFVSLPLVLPGVLVLMGFLLKAIVEGIAKVFVAVVLFIVGMGPTVGGAIVDAFGVAAGFIGEVGKILIGGFTTAFGEVVDFIFTDAVMWLWEAFVDGVGRAFRDVDRFIGGVGSDIIGGLGKGISFAWNRVIVPFFRGIPGVIGGFFTGAGGWLVDAGAGILRGAWEGLKDMWGSISGWFTKTVFPFFKGLGGEIFDFVKDVPDKLWEGIKDIGGAFKAPVNWVITKVLNPFLDLINKVVSFIPGVDEVQLNIKPIGDPPKEFHSGGIVGKGGRKRRKRKLSPDEEMIVAQKGEGVVPVSMMKQIARGLPPIGGALDTFVDTVNPIERSKDLAGAVVGIGREVKEVGEAVLAETIQQFRNFAAFGLEQAARPIFGAIGEAGKRFGFPGEILGGLFKMPLESLIDWVRGAGDEIDNIIGFIPQTTPPFQGLIDFLNLKGVGHQVMSTFRPGARTLSGRLSLHAQKKAVDFKGEHDPPGSILTLGMDEIWKAFSVVWRQLRELIYSGAKWQVLGGRQVSTESMRRNNPGLFLSHLNHVHSALADSGAMIPPGLSMIMNKTGRPEWIIPDELFQQLNLSEDVGRLIDSIEHTVASGPDSGDNVTFHVQNMDGPSLIREYFWRKGVRVRK